MDLVDRPALTAPTHACRKSSAPLHRGDRRSHLILPQLHLGTDPAAGPRSYPGIHPFPDGPREHQRRMRQISTGKTQKNASGQRASRMNLYTGSKILISSVSIAMKKETGMIRTVAPGLSRCLDNGARMCQLSRYVLSQFLVDHSLAMSCQE